MPAKIPESKRVGQSRRMNCGIMATCVAYRNNRDADFLFEDGSVAIKKAWCNFIGGRITPQTGKTTVQRVLEKQRVGQSRMMQCGLMATCTAYHDYRHADFRFENGTTTENKSWFRFMENTLQPPAMTTEDYAKVRVGQSRKMANGYTATCIAYRGSKNADFRFENGIVVTDRAWGEVSHD